MRFPPRGVRPSLARGIVDQPAPEVNRPRVGDGAPPVGRNRVVDLGSVPI